jgi:hypothetical protein
VNKYTKNGVISGAVFLAVFLFSYSITDARQGCCSWHGGVCGCGCCDGTGLSSTCAPYYPECNTPPPVKPYCGDVKCNGSETCLTCSKDCGVCPKSDDEKIKEKINSVKSDYQHNYFNFRENLIQDLISSYGTSVRLGRIGYFVYTMLPDINN